MSTRIFGKKIRSQIAHGAYEGIFILYKGLILKALSMGGNLPFIPHNIERSEGAGADNVFMFIVHTSLIFSLKHFKNINRNVHLIAL